MQGGPAGGSIQARMEEGLESVEAGAEDWAAEGAAEGPTALEFLRALDAAELSYGVDAAGGPPPCPLAPFCPAHVCWPGILKGWTPGWTRRVGASWSPKPPPSLGGFPTGGGCFLVFFLNLFSALCVKISPNVGLQCPKFTQYRSPGGSPAGPPPPLKNPSAGLFILCMHESWRG